MADAEDDSSWVTDLETALVEECDFGTLKNICKCRPVPDHLRFEVWQICLSVQNKGNSMGSFDELFDMEEQGQVRKDCRALVDKLGNEEEDKVSIISDLESIITFFSKSRNERYTSDSGWLDILQPLLALKQGRSEIYNCFYSLVNKYIPRECCKNGKPFHLFRLLLQYHDPELCSFLDTKKITPDTYAQTWFRSLFAAVCDLQVIKYMWDVYFQHGDPFLVFFMALVILVNAREQVLAGELESRQSLIEMLMSFPSGLEAEDIEDFCSLAQYYACKTPQSFRRDYQSPLFGTSMVPVKEEFGVMVSQALCLPVSVMELLQANKTSTTNTESVRYFVVDCRPAEQYNRGHLPTAFHLDADLMLQNPMEFNTAVQALLATQQHVTLSGAASGGEHLCFIGSGREEEDQYVHMVVANFLQKHHHYVSIARGGYGGNNSHQSAVMKIQSAKEMEIVVEKQHSKNKTAILAALKNVLFAARHNLASSIIPELNSLCIDQGCSSLTSLQVDAHTTYTHSDSINAFQQSLAHVCIESLVQLVRKSGVFSIMLDESTDVGVDQNLVVYIKYLEQVNGRVEARTDFLGLRKLDVATSDSIVREVLGLLEDRNLDVKDMVGIATDGASVMVGCRKGVVTQLRKESRGLLATHCIAHRLALSCGQAADRVRYLVKFQDVLNSMFKYFENSPKNMGRLKAVQSVLDKGSGTRLKQVFHTRWLSFEGAVQSVVDNYPGLISVFLEDGSARALAMHKPISSVKFLYCLYFLADVLKQLSILCKSFQRSSLDFAEADCLLRSTVEVVKGLRDGRTGSQFCEFVGSIPKVPECDDTGLFVFEFRGHTIRDGAAQREEARVACDRFVDGVLENLESRFSDEGDARLLSGLSSLFSPDEVVSGGDKVDETLCGYLGDVCSVSVGECKDEVLAFRSFSKLQVIRNRDVFASPADVSQIALRSREVFPIVCSAAERLLVAPVSTVDCERGFSRQNLIKTDLRNRLSPSSLDMLIRLSTWKRDLNLEVAFSHWANSKKRRILN